MSTPLCPHCGNRHRNDYTPPPCVSAPIATLPAPPSLSGYRHASTPNDAEWLVAHIYDLEAKGHKVLSATSARSSVPTGYRNAHRMHAPCYVFCPVTRTVAMEDAPLQTRGYGTPIPAHFTLEGDGETPAGYRCLSRTGNREVIPA